LIAAGPDFKRGETDDIASGNVDLAPTILQILSIKSPKQLDGRILSEVMTNSGQAAASQNDGVQSAVPAPLQNRETQTLEATKHFSSGTWRQSLQISRVGSTIYLDEGNGAFVAIEPTANESERNR
jgi:arylsulfatase A-like enzyme